MRIFSPSCHCEEADGRRSNPINQFIRLLRFARNDKRNALLALALSVAIPAFAREARPEKLQKISFITKDGVTLAATFRKPQPGQPVIIMLHGYQSTKEEWLPFTEALGKVGWGSLAYDARAHGASDREKRGTAALGAPGPGSQWERMVDDLGAAFNYLEQQDIARSSVVVCGASLGANVAARYAALSSPFRALVLLSPGLNYMEFHSEEDVVRIPTRTLIVASPEDKYAFSSSLRLKNLAPADALWTDVPPGHGVQMITPEFAARLIKWLQAAGK